MVVKLEHLLFEGPLTSGTQKFTGLFCLKENLDTVDIVREEVQNLLKPRNKNFKIKLAILKNDFADALERKLWTLFYVDVESMLRRTEALRAKATLL